MRILFSNHIYEFVTALMGAGHEIHVPDNAKRQKPPAAPNVHVFSHEVATDVEMAAAYISQHKIEIVYAQGRGAMVFYANVRNRLNGQWTFKIIVTVHTGYVWCVWWKSLAFIVLARLYSDGLIFLAETLRRKYGWFARLIGLKNWVVPNPVDLSRFPMKHDYARIGNQPLHLGYVGIITPMKGQDVLIDAVRILHERGMKIRLTLVGDVQYEWYHEKLKRAINRAALDEWVTIKPGVPYDEVPRFLETIDCYVCPSKVEVMPFNILEAMASGLPIVATGVGGILDLVISKANGEICDVGRSEHLAAAISEVASPKEISRMGENSRTMAEQLFSSQVFAAKMRNIFNTQLTGVR